MPFDGAHCTNKTKFQPSPRVEEVVNACPLAPYIVHLYTLRSSLRMLFISVRKAGSHFVRGDADHGLSNMLLRRQGKRQTDQDFDWANCTGTSSICKGHRRTPRMVVVVVGIRGGRRRDLGAAVWVAMGKVSLATKKQTNNQAKP
jgi:hypothetical protein